MVNIYFSKSKSKWDCLCHRQGSGRPPSDLQTHREDEARRRLLRCGGKKTPLNLDRLDVALWVAENGQKISIEVRVYMMSQGGSWHYVSGKNVSRVGTKHGDPGPRTANSGDIGGRHVKIEVSILVNILSENIWR